jgi:hypothetical protein
MLRQEAVEYKNSRKQLNINISVDIDRELLLHCIEK